MEGRLQCIEPASAYVRLYQVASGLFPEMLAKFDSNILRAGKSSLYIDKSLNWYLIVSSDILTFLNWSFDINKSLNKLN